MSKSRSLNLIDIVRLKKDLLWGKHYFGLFEQGKLIDSLLYTEAYENNQVLEILQIEANSKILVRDFCEYFSIQKKIRYFTRELDERESISDIEFMNTCGFKRYSRNYYYEFIGKNHLQKERSQAHVVCKEADREDLGKLQDIDIDAQIIEYRDQLYRSKIFFHKNLEKIYSFRNPQNLKEIYAYGLKQSQDCVEFIVHPKLSNLVPDLIYSFANKYIHSDKSANKFIFIINEGLNQEFKSYSKDFPLIKSTQLLILEGQAKEKSRQRGGYPRAIESFVKQ